MTRQEHAARLIARALDAATRPDTPRIADETGLPQAEVDDLARRARARRLITRALDAYTRPDTARIAETTGLPPADVDALQQTITAERAAKVTANAPKAKAGKATPPAEPAQDPLAALLNHPAPEVRQAARRAATKATRAAAAAKHAQAAAEAAAAEATAIAETYEHRRVLAAKAEALAAQLAAINDELMDRRPCPVCGHPVPVKAMGAHAARSKRHARAAKELAIAAAGGQR